MSGRDFGTRYMIYRLIINGLSATTGGAGREPADRIAARNNRHGIKRNSVVRESQEYSRWLGVVRIKSKRPQQICDWKQ